MRTTFHDRIHAGQVLAGLLRPLAHQPNTLVLALPRGGVPVGFEVARRLDVPLDVLIVRKLGLPGHEEYAMGAIAPGGVVVRNGDVAERHGVPEAIFARVVEREREELRRRELAYRAGRPAARLDDCTVLLVDDGIATGATMRAAVRAARLLGAAKVIVATPVASRDAVRDLQSCADEVVVALVPEFMIAIGEFYSEFTQTSDEEVVRLLAAGGTTPPKTGESPLPTPKTAGGRK